MQRQQSAVRVDNAFIERLRELSKNTRRPIADHIREALENYFTNGIPPIDVDAIYNNKEKKAK